MEREGDRGGSSYRAGCGGSMEQVGRTWWLPIEQMGGMRASPYRGGSPTPPPPTCKEGSGFIELDVWSYIDGGAWGPL